MRELRKDRKGVGGDRRHRETGPARRFASPSRGWLAGALLPLPWLAGCARSPSFNVLGSYFPGWIFCIVVGVLATSLLRWALNRLGWERRIPALPLFYFSLALLIACTIWLFTFE